MSRSSVGPSLDRPWHRPGAFRYALERLGHVLRPPVTVTEPPGGVVSELNVPVPVRDGTVLRVNVYRPSYGGKVPVIMCAHPYGKDRLPSLAGGRPRFSVQYRIMNQATPVSFSTLTGWEAPDPAWWVAQGYAVINADLRGAGTSEGVGSLLSDGEAEDYFDLITWAGSQAWSSGNVGLLGVSYLAMAQYKVAGLKPPSLKAICPWEGMTDCYRDLMRPGGLDEHGFTFVWTTMTRRVARTSPDMGHEERQRPLRDEWWASVTPDLGAIELPMLVCASFSDNNLHSRGSFRAFEQASSPDRFAFTHRGGKWATFYSEPRPRRAAAVLRPVPQGQGGPEAARGATGGA